MDALVQLTIAEIRGLLDGDEIEKLNSIITQEGVAYVALVQNVNDEEDRKVIPVGHNQKVINMGQIGKEYDGSNGYNSIAFAIVKRKPVPFDYPN